MLGKIQSAYDTVKNCPHSNLSEDLVIKIRQDWEPHYTPIRESVENTSIHCYSILSVYPKPIEDNEVQQIANAYFCGTKQIVFVADVASYQSLINAINKGYSTRNIQPRGNNLLVGFDKGIKQDTKSAMTFNIEVELCSDLATICPEPLTIVEGNLHGTQEEIN